MLEGTMVTVADKGSAADTRSASGRHQDPASSSGKSTQPIQVDTSNPVDEVIQPRRPGAFPPGRRGCTASPARSMPS
ncbi:hypothetical protein PGT21_013306 [Puccinia graminis f. sp. tritici]|uniref:Uncharacterized protein n=1 Tax=Puccinia graminis f. sp. tritici TaxID=56615 RepID=A0A5B0M3B2_PUCGR|nr:hypothetical protein PGTUg99_021129 [Puccinia graminis f. sp. tritici]KAA1071627.1 hypothetical protein PGT21_013306 [Puccinia graminis f. sp. tritici]